MYFKRKVYDKLLEWKKLYSEKYAVLLEGARRVGKSTIAETFAKNEYRSYILIDFSKTTSNILECFDDIGNLNIFFLRLQAETGITLYEHESLIIFDEVRLFPMKCKVTGIHNSDKEKCKGHPDSIRGNEDRSISHGLRRIL